jgi:hypothetical protein
MHSVNWFGKVRRPVVQLVVVIRQYTVHDLPLMLMIQKLTYQQDSHTHLHK